MLAQKIDTLSCKIDEFGKIVAVIDTRPIVKTWLEKNWKGILIILVSGFLIIHSLIPTNFNLWDWITKIL